MWKKVANLNDFCWLFIEIIWTKCKLISVKEPESFKWVTDYLLSN